MAVGFAACKDNGDVIRLNEVTHSLFYTPQYLAMALGYFEEEGISVDVTNGQGANNVMTALLTNEADTAAGYPRRLCHCHRQATLR